MIKSGHGVHKHQFSKIVSGSYKHRDNAPEGFDPLNFSDVPVFDSSSKK